MARIRGDSLEERTFLQARTLVEAQQIGADADLGAFLESPPPGTDADVLKRLRFMFEAGAWVLFESVVADLPSDLRWLYESGAVTIEHLAALHDRLGVTALADLIAAVEQGRIREVLDETAESAVEQALRQVRQSTRRIPLGRAIALAEPLLTDLRSLAGVEWAEPVGSFRRGQDTVGDIELIASASQPARAVEAISRRSDVDRVLHTSSRRIYVLVNQTQVGVRLAKPANAGAGLLYLTGSSTHIAALRSRAARKGWQLTPDGLRDSSGTLRTAATELDLYADLGLPFIPPEIRDTDEAIVSAERGSLPSLLTRRDMRGDLHMHSDWSDGHDSMESMASTCHALGYEYIAFTDHSPSSGASRSLSIATVKRQAEQIAAIRERFSGMTILHGCEVDILPEGQLDFPDPILEQFDIVLASLHQRAGQEPGQLLSRYLQAMNHPLVTLITHPTNRLVPHRAGYDLDYDRLFAAAAETGTLLEIDGAPSHLDLDGALARRAVAAGATVAVNSDCHRADRLERQMQLGIMTARRGWVEARHVFNTRPIAEVLALIARKRAS